jgi:homoserine trans-succinylase
MPTKIATETQLMRLLGNTALQVAATLVRLSSHESKNTPEEHLQAFYKTFDEVRNARFDGMIITGAPVEHLEVDEAESDDAGVYIAASQDGRQIFVTGHSEYDADTLKREYDRDVAAGLPIEIPRNYYPNDDPARAPLVRWRGHSNLLFANWINYYVYQETPYDLNQPAEFIRQGL